eukprot:m.456066 g.456066  ORF g.456066 m.456066 type:complete len:139 (+) comp20982_c0_seq1:244-660(+)
MASLAALFRGRPLKEVWLDVDVRTAILDRAARRSLLAADQWVTEQALDAIAQLAKVAGLWQSLWDTCGQTLCEALSFNGWCTSGPVKCARGDAEPSCSGPGRNGVQSSAPQSCVAPPVHTARPSQDHTETLRFARRIP